LKHLHTLKDKFQKEAPKNHKQTNLKNIKNLI